MGLINRLFGKKDRPDSSSMTDLSILTTTKSTLGKLPAHIVILVKGTLWHAEQGALQLKMCGVGKDTVTGIAALFGVEHALHAEIAEGKWVPLEKLIGFWLLIIPESAYSAYLAHLPDAPIDGRVYGEDSPCFTINETAVKQVEDLLIKRRNKQPEA